MIPTPTMLHFEAMGGDAVMPSLSALFEEDEDDQNHLNNVNYWFSMRNRKRKRGGSLPGKSAHLERGREEAAIKLQSNDFVNRPFYHEGFFRRKLRMKKSLFLNILNDLCNHDSYFVQKMDALGKPGFTPHQKMT